MAKASTEKPEAASKSRIKGRKNKKPTFTEQARRKQILEIAFKLFKEKGYDQTSIEEIAEQVGVSRGVIFYYFNGKREIGEEVVVKGLRDYSHYVQDRMKQCKSPKARLLEFVSGCLDYSNEHRKNYLVYIDTLGRFSNTEGRMDFFCKVNEQTRTMLVEIIKEGQAQGEISKMPAQDLADIIQGVVDGLAQLCAIQPDIVSLEGCKRLLRKILLSAIES